MSWPEIKKLFRRDRPVPERVDAPSTPESEPPSDALPDVDEPTMMDDLPTPDDPTEEFGE